ncbi:MAG: sporulation protein YqfC [Tissierellales bacterium]
MKKKIDDMKKNFSEILELPKEIMLDFPKITFIGNLQLYIENHKGIIEYGSLRIRVNTNAGILRVVGKNMVIKTIVMEEIVIVGEIDSLEFT